MRAKLALVSIRRFGARQFERVADWPVRQPCLVFAGVALDKPEYLALCKKLDAGLTVKEVLRNLPVHPPMLWF